MISAVPLWCVLDDRQAARHRLQRRVRKRIVERREHESVRGAVPRAHVALGPGEMDARREAERANEALGPCLRLVAADDQQARIFQRGLRERLDEAKHALSFESRSDVKKHDALRGIPSRWRKLARCASRSRGWKGLEIDTVVDHVKFRFRRAEVPADLVLHHARIADHGTQARAREQAPLGGENVAVIGVEGYARAESGRGPRSVNPLRSVLRRPACGATASFARASARGRRGVVRPGAVAERIACCESIARATRARGNGLHNVLRARPALPRGHSPQPLSPLRSRRRAELVLEARACVP